MTVERKERGGVSGAGQYRQITYADGAATTGELATRL